MNDVPDPSGSTRRSLDGVTGRAVPQLAFNWRYPWARSDGGLREVIEPIAQFATSPMQATPDGPNRNFQHCGNLCHASTYPFKMDRRHRIHECNHRQAE